MIWSKSEIKDGMGSPKELESSFYHAQVLSVLAGRKLNIRWHNSYWLNTLADRKPRESSKLANISSPSMGAAILQQFSDHVTLFWSHDLSFDHMTTSRDLHFEQNGVRLLWCCVVIIRTDFPGFVTAWEGLWTQICKNVARILSGNIAIAVLLYCPSRRDSSLLFSVTFF